MYSSTSGSNWSRTPIGKPVVPGASWEKDGQETCAACPCGIYIVDIRRISD